MAEEENTEGEGKGGGLNKILIPVALLRFWVSEDTSDGSTLEPPMRRAMLMHLPTRDHNPESLGPRGYALDRGGLTSPTPKTTRYIKVTCHLEVTDADEQVALEPLLPPIRNRMLIYLTGLRAEEARGPENQERHRVGLLNAINNDVFREDRILDLYFTEYVVQ